MGKGWRSGPRGGKLVKPVDLRDLRVDNTPELDAQGGSGAAGSVDKFALYQSAVQAPQGDISWMLRFYRQYVGLQVPLHLQEDFCGTALICATWCKGDVRRTAIGVDVDMEALAWGAQHNGDGMLGGSAADQLCLLHSNVLDDVSSAPRVTAQPDAAAAARRQEPQTAAGGDTNPAASQLDAEANGGAGAAAAADQAAAAPPADAAADEDQDEDREAGLRSRKNDIVAALNFSLCLLHTRELAVRYLHLAHAAMDSQGGSIMVLDLLGGPAAEVDMKLDRTNTVTAASFLWEQEGFSPVTREIYCHISLRQCGIMVLPRIWNYHWRLWTIPEAMELLLAAGFDAVHVWLRPMRQTAPQTPQSSGRRGGRRAQADDVEEDEEEAEFREVTAKRPLTPAELLKINRGWTAYLIAVVAPKAGS